MYGQAPTKCDGGVLRRSAAGTRATGAEAAVRRRKLWWTRGRAH
jgi:hypothetical protein